MSPRPEPYRQPTSPFSPTMNAARKIVFPALSKDGRVGQHHHHRW